MPTHVQVLVVGCQHMMGVLVGRAYSPSGAQVRRRLRAIVRLVSHHDDLIATVGDVDSVRQRSVLEAAQGSLNRVSVITQTEPGSNHAPLAVRGLGIGSACGVM